MDCKLVMKMGCMHHDKRLNPEHKVAGVQKFMY